MEWVGLALLGLVGAGIILTGLPAAVVLLAVATLGAIIAIASGTIEFATLGALSTRLINLFENDLLQALPLYVTMGLLLDRLPIANALYRAGNALLSRSAAGIVEAIDATVTKLASLQAPEQIVESKLMPVIEGLTGAVNSLGESAEAQAKNIENNLKHTQTVVLAITELLHEIHASETPHPLSARRSREH